MTPALRASARFWISGTAVAMVGVAINRLLARGFDGRMHSALALTGELVALSGLMIILFGIRRRLRSGVGVTAEVQPENPQ